MVSLALCFLHTGAIGKYSSAPGLSHVHQTAANTLRRLVECRLLWMIKAISKARDVMTPLLI